MAEKGDVGQDTVSLPPTYAPSEAYTESPPPAYRGGRLGGGKVVQIVRHVCFTAVVLVLLIGFFVLSSNYLKARSCSCENQDTAEGRAALLQAGSFLQPPPPPPSASPLVGKEKEESENNLDLDDGDKTAFGEEMSPEEKNQVEQMVDEMEKQMEEEVKDLVMKEEEEEEVLKDIITAQADHMKKIRLPINMILGKPDLDGKEVNCEVERRRVPIGPGIMSQTILVTCKDGDDMPLLNPLTPSKPFPKPPMSLIAPLMKILTSRPGPQPRLVPVRGPMPFPIPMDTPMRPPFLSKPRFTVLPRKTQEFGPSDKMLPRNLQPIVRLTPRFLAAPRDERNSVSLMGLQRGLPVPQARGRAPPSPVSLSPLPPRSLPFLPFNVLDLPPPPLPPRPATHMEMKNEDQDQDFSSPPRQDFGPPRGHTLIRPPHNSTPAPLRSLPRILTLPNTIRIHTMPRNAPPPPRFDPEPRRSSMPQLIESEAEIIRPPPLPQHSEAPPTPPTLQDNHSSLHRTRRQPASFPHH